MSVSEWNYPRVQVRQSRTRSARHAVVDGGDFVEQEEGRLESHDYGELCLDRSEGSKSSAKENGREVSLPPSVIFGSVLILTVWEVFRFSQRHSWDSGNLFETLWRTPEIPVALIMAASTLAQAISGFGFAIVAVGLLQVLPHEVSESISAEFQTVIGIIGACIGVVLLVPDHTKIQWREILPLVIASSMTTPAGRILIAHIDASDARKLLGGVILCFVILLWSGMKLPKGLGSNRFAWIFGSVAGLLGGAFQVPGPALVFFGSARGWKSENIRPNILTVVTFNAAVVTLWNLIQSKMASPLVTDFLISSAPIVILAILSGQAISGRIQGSLFIRTVLGFCSVIALQLLAMS